MKGFFPGEGYDASRFTGKEPPLIMLVPLLVFAALTVLIGLLPNALTDSLYTYAVHLLTLEV